VRLIGGPTATDVPRRPATKRAGRADLDAGTLLPVHAEGWAHVTEGISDLRAAIARHGLIDSLWSLTAGGRSHTLTKVATRAPHHSGADDPRPQQRQKEITMSTQKVAVITGASQGAYRKLGYAVVANSRSIVPSDDPLVLTAGDIADPAVGARAIEQGLAASATTRYRDSRDLPARYLPARCRRKCRDIAGGATPVEKPSGPAAHPWHIPADMHAVTPAFGPLPAI
jgi:hypothetical protein